MTMSTVTLFMIVKNESRIIERCLESLRQFIDYVVITDTGSTDNTVELIEKYLSTHNIRGKVCYEPWKNFGYNRSVSYTNMQKWLDEEKIDKSKNYGLTVDADMCVQFLNADYRKNLHLAPGWIVKQKNIYIEYWNMRMMRSDLDYKCVGVTHEYWSCDGVNSSQNNDLVINDIGDGGAKADKFTRDIALLTKGLEEEPTNHRYMFYLANSYSDSGHPKEAIEWYKKRIEGGGWFEEVFMAWRNLGSCYMQINEPEKAIDAWMNGYQMCPRRSETLHRIVNHYRVAGKNQLALLFLRQGFRIPFPSDMVLFVEHAIYKYSFVDELSIISYYTNLKHEGRLSCQYLMMYPEIPDFHRQQAKSNNFYYLEPLSPGARDHKVLSIPTREPYISSSSSLFIHPKNKHMRGIVRAVNYSMDDRFNYTARHPNGIVDTINYWCEFDPEGKTTQCYEIEYAPSVKAMPKHIVHVQGLEDMRACFVGNQLYTIAVDREYGRNSHPSILLCHLTPNDATKKYQITKTIPITFRDDRIQKNWTVFTDQGKLMMCYGHHPLTILEVEPNTGDVKIVCEKYSRLNFEDIRGSANPIRVVHENAWLFLVHEVAWRDTRKYFHRFLKYNNNWDLVDVSEPFYFNNLYVEFSLSIMMDKNKVFIPFSTKDNSTELLTINYDNIQWLPKDIPGTLRNMLAI